MVNRLDQADNRYSGIKDGDLSKFNRTAGEMKELMLGGAAAGLAGSASAQQMDLQWRIEVVNKIPKAFLAVIRFSNCRRRFQRPNI